MPQTNECDFCGGDIEPGTGTMFVRTDGTTVRFCSSKCEKNADLGRRARDLEWTSAGEERRAATEPADTDAGTEADEEPESVPATESAADEEPESVPATESAADEDEGAESDVEAPDEGDAEPAEAPDEAEADDGDEAAGEPAEEEEEEEEAEA